MVGALKCTTALVVVGGIVVGGGGCAVVGCTHTVLCSVLCAGRSMP
jgi:hypothetical protein